MRIVEYTPFFGNRFEITLRLKAKSDLHVGSGALVEQPHLRDDDDEGTAHAAMLIRDHAGNVILPATSIKGVLRSLATLDEVGQWVIFGDAHDGGTRLSEQRSQGRMARLWFDHCVAEPDQRQDFGSLTQNGGTIQGRPHEGFFKAGVAIDPDRGTASDHKLFNSEMLGRGAIFHLCSTLFFDRDAKDPSTGETALLAAFARVIAPLLHDEGVMFGARTRQGFGRLCLDKTHDAPVKVVRKTLNAATLKLEAEDCPELARSLQTDATELMRGSVSTIRMQLLCTGPFISMRERRQRTERRQGRQDADGQDAMTEETVPLEWQGRPHLWSGSLLGALRKRAAWIAECDRLVQGDACAFAPSGLQGNHPIDDRDMETTFEDKKAVTAPSDVFALSSVQRLFGVAGWRGLLRVVKLEADGERAQHAIKGVRIDRFTGGGIPGALFQTKVFYNTVFTALLAVDEHRQINHEPAIQPADRRLLEKLREDLELNGIMLGHGGARGYGWFELQEWA